MPGDLGHCRVQCFPRPPQFWLQRSDSMLQRREWRKEVGRGSERGDPLCQLPGRQPATMEAKGGNGLGETQRAAQKGKQEEAEEACPGVRKLRRAAADGLGATRHI